MPILKTIFTLLKDTFQQWNEDRAPRLAAALAYYTTFSIAPFLIVVIAVTGLIAGQDAIRGRLDEQIQALVGRQGADMIQELIQNNSQPAENIIATVVGLVTLVLGAGGVFGQLQDSLNTVWGVQPKPGRGLLATIKDRFLSFSMVLGVGFLLLVSLILSSFLASVHSFFLGLLPAADLLLQILNFVVSFSVVTLLFALIYKVLPDVTIRWRDVWVGAAFTSLLFSIGKTVLGIYLGNSNVFSAYGAAGSLIVILLWIFYSAQILLFGAEFTQVYAQRYGAHIIPSENAIALTAAAHVPERLTMTPGAEKMPHTNADTADVNTGTNPNKVLPMITPRPLPDVVPKQVVTEPPNLMFAIAGACLGFLVGFLIKINQSNKSNLY